MNEEYNRSTPTEGTRTTTSKPANGTQPDSQPYALGIPSESMFIYVLIPPDGGYAWIILLTSFVICACVDGMLLSAGSVLDKVSSDLDLSTSEMTSLSSIQNALYLFSGPVVCAIANNVGFRIPAIIGSTTAAIGLIIGSFCSSWLTLFLTYGALVGIGFGFVSSPNSLIVGHYFEKYRTIAFCIASSGVGAGTIIFSFLNVFLLNHLSWRNTIRVYFCICIFLGFISLLFRPIKPINIKSVQNFPKESEESLESESIESVIISNRFNPSDEDNVTESHTSRERQDQQRKFRRFSTVVREEIYNRLPRFFQCFKKFQIAEKANEEPPPPVKIFIEKRPLFREDIFLNGNIPLIPEEQQDEQTEQITTTMTSSSQKSLRAKSRKMSVLIVRPRGTEKFFGKSPTLDERKLSLFVPTMREFTTKSIFQKIKNEEFDIRKIFKIPPTIKKAFNLLFDTSIFETPSIRIYLASSFFITLGNIVPFLFVQKHGENNGIPPSITNWFITTLGIINVLFRIICGLIATMMTNLNPIHLPAIFLLFSGIFTFLAGLVGHSSVLFQFFWLIMFGIGSATFIALRSSIIVYCIGIEKLTSCYGISMLIFGVGSFLGTTFAGILVSMTKSYEAAFLFAGCGLCVSSILLFGTAFVSNLEKEIKNKQKW